MELIDNKPKTCKFCNCEHIIKCGKLLRTGRKLQRYQCTECGKTFY